MRIVHAVCSDIRGDASPHLFYKSKYLDCAKYIFKSKITDNTMSGILMESGLPGETIDVTRGPFKAQAFGGTGEKCSLACKNQGIFIAFL